MSDTPPAPISVTRCRGGVVEGQFQAHRLRLPDGRCGVRWAGLVFPLQSGDRIEVTDGASLPGECQPWSVERPWWRVIDEAGTTEAYVFVDGPASARDRMLTTVTRAGLQPLRSGPNMSAMPGDWFIRVLGWDDMAGQRMTDLAGSVAPPTAQDAALLRQRMMQERLEQVSAERDALRQQLAEARERLSAAMSEMEAGSISRAQLESLVDTIEPVDPHPDDDDAGPAGSVTGHGEQDVAKVVQHLLPRIDLVRRSLTFVCVELADKGGLWRGLAELDRAERGTPAAWKSVRGAEGWIERHFSNGQDNQGRLYARHAAARWDVLVSHKQDQPSDMRWLRQRGGTKGS